MPDARRVKSGYLDRSSALAAAANLPEFLAKLPKAELHVHIEGCLTPQLCHSIAVRNGLDATAFDPAEATRRRQCGSWLHGDYQPMLFCGPNEMAINAFLTEYTRCNAIMRTEQDFYELMLGYLERAAENGVVRAEIFFDPQMHCFEDSSGAGAAAAEAMGGPPRMPCGVGGPRMPYAAVIAGLWRGIEEGRARFGVDGALILSFLQDRSLEEAMAVLDEALKPGNVGKIVGVGMDNGTGPWGHGSTSRFKPAYEKAKAAGLMLSAHAGEEEGAACVEMCLDVLKCDRIDHGVRCLEDSIAAMRREDAAVVRKLKDRNTPCTVCPISNHRAQIVGRTSWCAVPRIFCGESPVRAMLEAGLHSDDPAYCAIGTVDERCYACEPQTYDGYVNSAYMRAARDSGTRVPDWLHRRRA
ncbi:hypothetical protein EMIHUDRAFT_100604 [Emiliania huxleyi CCMP1516]|uniref:Adenosine deaminase domain-containing protein n=2 Tax=Emiliania huxleyi TaxID=2903 RepID=A0A0D3JSU5_EMIH1|nr:hypothetical protein EMIHUDRAFT_100604 [Emiliania huxleyi CCMP1516]EOD26580.1 hypothetical protein EMIHUDRAFT_100604 [Emiliania huxleyi CCMP1516]|eukprot:XP_005779009.1 hypothetical protein EMIHUDRAFT_100604 [Emiliania huxleyi CCMP1516]